MLVLNAVLVAADDQPPALEQAAAEQLSFRNDVQPILKRHCWGCHSAAKPEGGLRLDTVADMLKGGDSGPLFEPGQPDESMLVQMIVGNEPEMPKQQQPLSVAKIQTLRHWILAGAKDDSLAVGSPSTIQIPQAYLSPPAVSSVALSPDGKLLAAACRSEVVLIDVDAETAPRRLPTECDLITHVEFNADGTLLAASGGSPAQYGEVRFFNPADGAVVSSRRVGHDTLFRGNFAPDGKSIALGGADGAIHIVPLDPNAPVRSFDLHSDWILDVAYSPDGTMLISGGRDKATKISSVETGQLLRSVDGSTELISAVAVDGQFAVSAGRARTLIGYELKTALSGIGVTGSGNGAQPITNRDQYVKNFEGQPGEVLDLAFSGDRKLVAVAGDFAEVRIYQIADRQRVVTIANAPAPIYSVALNADGTRLVLGSKSGQVQVYQLPAGTLIKTLVPVPIVTPDQTAL
ncbi:MAG: c-type cytochrome domain-containing protein [Betaproteobacteria bacterium]